MTFQILSLSGGGYRGLFTIEVLAKLEERAGRPIGSCFDLIAGTSIGGIIAIGLAMGKTAKEIRQAFLDHGEDIFPYHPPIDYNPAHILRVPAHAIRMLKAIWKPLHPNEPLRNTIAKILDGDPYFGEAKTRLLIPSINMTKGSVQMFKTPHHPKLYVDKDLKAIDVAMATSAAPFIFPLAQVGESLFTDGGLVANSPDACAIHEAVHYAGQLRDDVTVLSIGTTSSKFGVPSSYGAEYGARKWVKDQRILTTMFAVQQQLVDFMITQELHDRYVRIDEMASPEQSIDLGLDKASKKQRKTLLGLAEAAYQRVCADERILKALKHQPVPPEFVSTYKRPDKD